MSSAAVMLMDQTVAQALAVRTWGENATAEVKQFDDGPCCYVSRSKYGLTLPYGHGATFEQAFYNSQFGYSTDTAYNGGVPCHADGFTGNRSNWPDEWREAIHV